jgi:hypothetical protein
MGRNPTKDPEFKRVLGNLLKMPPKPHADMKIGKGRVKGISKRVASKSKEKPTS